MERIYFRKWVSGEGKRLSSENKHIFYKLEYLLLYQTLVPLSPEKARDKSFSRLLCQACSRHEDGAFEPVTPNAVVNVCTGWKDWPFLKKLKSFPMSYRQTIIAIVLLSLLYKHKLLQIQKVNVNLHN